MSARRDPDRLIHAFLLEGAEQLHDQVYDAVRAEIEQKRQRAVIGPWRMPTMNKLVPIGLGTAAVAVALVAGMQFLPTAPGGTGAAPSASPSPTPTLTPQATAAAPSASAAAAPTPPPLTQNFTSTLHGVSVSYPEGWTVRAATAPWTEGTFPLNFDGTHADFLYDPTLRAGLFLTIASQPIGDSTPEEWLAEQMASDEGCGTTTEPIAVDGGTGLIGDGNCTVVVATTAGRGYWIQLYTGDSAPVTYDRAWFDDVLATVQLNPEDAVDPGPTPSP